MKTLLSSITFFSFALSCGIVSAGENCGLKKKSLSHLTSMQKHICQKAIDAGYDGHELGCYKEEGLGVAHFEDQDNSTTEIDIHDGSWEAEVGKAMATVLVMGKVSQAVQVCEGVYLASAHGVIDSPKAAAKRKRDCEASGRDSATCAERGKIREPITEDKVYTFAYPMKREDVMKGVKLTSPMLGSAQKDPQAWKNAHNDYVFIEVDDAKRSDSFVRPASASISELVDYEAERDTEVKLFRGKTIFETDEKGMPDHNMRTAKAKFADLAENYEAPLVVNQPCNFLETNAQMLGTHCQGEAAVSGAGLVTKVNNQPYLVSTMNKGAGENKRTSEKDNANKLLHSKAFCSDYEKACGQPCVNLRDIHKPQFDTVSL